MQVASGPDLTLVGGMEDVAEYVDGAAEAEVVDGLAEAANTVADGDGSAESAAPGAADARPATTKTASRRRILFGLAVVIVLSTLLGWLGFRTYQSHQVQDERGQFLQAARQGALNLTTFDWQHADVDVHRVLDGLTGEFFDDFANRSQPFIEAVKTAQATSTGTIIETGLESQSGNEARVLVVVGVKTAYAGAPEQAARQWRMRFVMKKVDDQVKVSDVEFVP